MRLVASHDAEEGSLKTHTDVRIYLAQMAAAAEVRHDLAAGRHAWLQVLRGSVSVNGMSLTTSDGLAISEESSLVIYAQGDTERDAL